jgi:hypothetical protein
MARVKERFIRLSNSDKNCWKLREVQVANSGFNFNPTRIPSVFFGIQSWDLKAVIPELRIPILGKFPSKFLKFCR